MNPTQEVKAPFLKNEKSITLKAVVGFPMLCQPIAVDNNVKEKPSIRLEYAGYFIQNSLVISLIAETSEFAKGK